MKPLAKTFTKDGFTFTQVEREGDLAIYHKQKPGQESEVWEVVRIGSHNGFTIGGNVIAPAETYPSSESWGVCGFTCYSRQNARQRVSDMQKGYCRRK